MSLKSLKIFKNNQTGLIWKFKVSTGQVRSTSKRQQNKCHRSFESFSLNENLKIKGFNVTETRQKSEPRKIVIFDK